jgi:hypothetical protein
VDTLQFLLFLYIQQLNRISLRTSLIGEEWPSRRSRPQSPSPAERPSCHNKVLLMAYKGNDSPSLKKSVGMKPGIVEHACKYRSWEAEPGRLSIQGQPRLLSKTLKKKKMLFSPP